MSSINSNSGFFNAQNSTNVTLKADEVFEGLYSSTLNYSTIEISVKCDTHYNLSVIYSPDSVNDEYTESEDITEVLTETRFFKFEPKMRFFKVRLTNIDSVDMSELSLNCIQKSSFVYSVSNVENSVSIANPLNMDGSVRVGGDLNLSGDVNANITNDDLNVIITNTESIGVIVNNTEPVPISNDNIDNLSFDAFDNLNININNVNSNFLTNNGLRVYNVSDVPIINSSTQTFLNVLDSTVNNNLVAVKNDITKSNKSSTALWASQLTGVAGVSLPANLTTINQTNITIFGNVSGATNLIVQFSIDNTTYYDSQYSFNSSAGGDVGFNIQSSVNYVRVKSTNDITCTLFCSVN